MVVYFIYEWRRLYSKMTRVVTWRRDRLEKVIIRNFIYMCYVFTFYACFHFYVYLDITYEMEDKVLLRKKIVIIYN